MAKELAMAEKNDKGCKARRYFIACEKHSGMWRWANALMPINWLRCNQVMAEVD